MSPSSVTFELDASAFDATVEVPGDKSLGHRALIFSALATGTSEVRGLSQGADIGATAGVLRSLGVTVRGTQVTSPGRERWVEPPESLDCGNSGTTMRLMTGALAGASVPARLVGDESLSMRPMQRLVEPLTALGARMSVSGDGTPPIDINPGSLAGADVAIPTASAQVRSAFALAAMGASGSSSIDSPPGFRDHTERWLNALGRGEYVTDTRFHIEPGPIPTLDLTVPGDPSSAAFLWACAAAIPGASVTTPGVAANPGRLGFLEVLELMGARIEVRADPAVLGDPVATITVTGRSLVGTTVSGPLAVRALDELPLVAVLASVADGPTTVKDAAELRVKESDRVAASVELATLAGASGVPTDDGFEIRPSPSGAPADTISSRGDHRIAMAAAVSAAITGASVTVEGFEASDVSWPGFKETLEALWS